MTLEEAIAWCRDRRLSINFTTPEDNNFPQVSIMNKHGIVDDVLGEGNSVEKAVQNAIDKIECVAINELNKIDSKIVEEKHL